MKDRPSNIILYDLFYGHIKDVKSIQTMLEVYRQDIYYGRRQDKDYPALLRLVKCELVRLRRDINRDSLERSNPLQSGRSHSTPATALSVVQKGDCHSWIKHGSCSRGNDCAFQHDTQKKGACKDDMSIENPSEPIQACQHPK